MSSDQGLASQLVVYSADFPAGGPYIIDMDGRVAEIMNAWAVNMPKSFTTTLRATRLPCPPSFGWPVLTSVKRLWPAPSRVQRAPSPWWILSVIRLGRIERLAEGQGD